MKKPIIYTVGPAVFFLMVFGFLPLVLNFLLSLRNVSISNLGGTWGFIGIRNYIALFSDDRVLSSFLTTCVFVSLSVIICMLIGTLFALLLSQNIRGISIFRSIQIIPIVATPIVLAVVWRFLLDPTAGPLRLIFKQLGMSNIALLSSSKYTLLTVVLIDVWIWAPFVTIIILGAISMLPQEPFEAASIDGASKLQQFFYLTLPFLKQALIISATLRFVDSLKTFGVVWVLTKGGPGFATNILGLEIYQRGFKFYHYAEAAGLGILLIFLAIFAGNIFFKSSKGAEL